MLTELQDGYHWYASTEVELVPRRNSAFYSIVQRNWDTRIVWKREWTPDKLSGISKVCEQTTSGMVESILPTIEWSIDKSAA